MPEELDEGVKDDAVKDDAAGDDAVKDDIKDDKVKDDKEVDPDGDKPPVEYKLALPKDSLLEPSTVDEIVSYAKEQGLSNEAAQKMLERENGAVAGYQEAQDKEVKEIRDGWKGETKADKELGGENFTKSSETALRVIDRFATKDFKTLLEDTGFGDHPEVVRIFTRIGAMMTDDQFVQSKAQASGKERSDADILFGDEPSGDSSTA